MVDVEIVAAAGKYVILPLPPMRNASISSAYRAVQRGIVVMDFAFTQTRIHLKKTVMSPIDAVGCRCRSAAPEGAGIKLADNWSPARGRYTGCKLVIENEAKVR